MEALYAQHALLINSAITVVGLLAIGGLVLLWRKKTREYRAGEDTPLSDATPLSTSAEGMEDEMSVREDTARGTQNARMDMQPLSPPDAAAQKSAAPADTTEDQGASLSGTVPPSRKRVELALKSSNKTVDIGWMQNTAESDARAESDESSAAAKKYSIIFGSIVAGVLVLGAGGFYFYSNSGGAMQQMDAQRISITHIGEQEETDASVDDVNARGETDGEMAAQDTDNAATTEEIDRAALSILVLNGGAAAGSAGDMADALTQQGYENVDADNAQNDYTGITLFYTAENAAVADVIAADLADTYDAITKTEDGDLVQKLSVDIVIIVGA